MYTPPLTSIVTALENFAQLDSLAATGKFPNYDAELIAPILEEAGKLANEILAPLNAAGDKSGARLEDGGVIAAEGFTYAYDIFRDSGWMGLSFPEEYGGQHLPRALALAVMEMVHGANMAFGLCPLLSFGAIEALLAHGTEAQKNTYLPNMISGAWTGTMNLTEPQSGSDLGTLKTKAEPNADGSFALSGQKIYITWGDHDLTENIIHLVLARLPDAPEGSKGISLFVCPKFIVNDDGSLGDRNEVYCIGLEEKLGIHASPTCVMEFDNATGWLVGEANRGLPAMFTMMNSARLGVGLEGVGVGEAALQTAQTYANERKQGRRAGQDGSAAIIHHPDIQRTLITMQADVAAMRAICYACGAAADIADYANDPTSRHNAKMRFELLTPIAKAWSTDKGVTLASQAVQVHGGMGFMADCLAAQLYRDARILPIYEGTNGIQAMDLVGRKLTQNDGAPMRSFINEMRLVAADAHLRSDANIAEIATYLEAAIDGLETATKWIQAETTARDSVLYVASQYLDLAGNTAGGFYLLKAALNASDTQADDSAIIAKAFALNRLAQTASGFSALTKTGDDYPADYLHNYIT